MVNINKNIKVIDLFSGIGGLTYGFKSAGLNVVAGIDNDPTCKYGYEKSNGTQFILKDINDVSAQDLSILYKNSEIKVLAGCAPCQPYSKLNQKGISDSKMLPLKKFASLIKELKPEIVSMENVAGLTNTDKYPVFQVNFQAGMKDILGGEYNYQTLVAKVSKTFYIAPLGISEWALEAGRVFGTVPYPLLEIHRANQSYSYQLQAYNLMNFLEFASDKYAALSIQHNFGGFFFNKVPWLRRLKWREVASFKGLYGGLDKRNQPSSANSLLRFPVDENGRTVTNTLENKPYMEASVGIANIFKLFRVDYVRRLTYTDLPGVSKWGIRARFKLDF